MYVDSDDWRRSCELLSQTFGVVSFSPVTKVSSDLAQLEKAVVEYSEPLLSEGSDLRGQDAEDGQPPVHEPDAGREARRGLAREVRGQGHKGGAR